MTRGDAWVPPCPLRPSYRRAGQVVTSSTPVLQQLVAETFVVPGVAVLVVGGLENSAVLPPATEAIVTTLGNGFEDRRQLPLQIRH